jgi:hypothetical protein
MGGRFPNVPAVAGGSAALLNLCKADVVAGSAFCLVESTAADESVIAAIAFEFVTIDADSSDVTKLADIGSSPGGVGVNPGLTWSPDGTLLAVNTHTAADGDGPYELNADGSDLHLVDAGGGGPIAWQPLPACETPDGCQEWDRAWNVHRLHRGRHQRLLRRHHREVESVEGVTATLTQAATRPPATVEPSLVSPGLSSQDGALSTPPDPSEQA